MDEQDCRYSNETKDLSIFVKPVLTDNFVPLAFIKNENKDLDCIHQKQLRLVWNDKRIHDKEQNTISN